MENLDEQELKMLLKQEFLPIEVMSSKEFYSYNYSEECWEVIPAYRLERVNKIVIDFADIPSNFSVEQWLHHFRTMGLFFLDQLREPSRTNAINNYRVRVSDGAAMRSVLELNYKK